jgi:hypothetical protein
VDWGAAVRGARAQGLDGGFRAEGKPLAVVSDDHVPKGDEEYRSTMTSWNEAAALLLRP